MFVPNVGMAVGSEKENIQRSDTNCWGRGCWPVRSGKASGKAESDIEYKVIISRIIIRRDGSGIVVPIRIRTDSDTGCLSTPFCVGASPASKTTVPV